MRKNYIYTFRQRYVSNGIEFSLSRKIAANDNCEAMKIWSFRPEVQSLEQSCQLVKNNQLLDLTISRVAA